MTEHGGPKAADTCRICGIFPHYAAAARMQIPAELLDSALLEYLNSTDARRRRGAMSATQATDEEVIILIRRWANEESWLVVYADGRILHHTENERYRFLRHGAEAEDMFIALDDVMKIGGEKLVAKVQLVRATLQAGTQALV